MGANPEVNHIQDIVEAIAKYEYVTRFEIYELSWGLYRVILEGIDTTGNIFEYQGKLDFGETKLVMKHFTKLSINPPSTV